MPERGPLKLGWPRLVMWREGWTAARPAERTKKQPNCLAASLIPAKANEHAHKVWALARHPGVCV